VLDHPTIAEFHRRHEHAPGGCSRVGPGLCARAWSGIGQGVSIDGTKIDVRVGRSCGGATAADVSKRSTRCAGVR
jgi:hypothetical protein